MLTRLRALLIQKDTKLTSLYMCTTWGLRALLIQKDTKLQNRWYKSGNGLRALLIQKDTIYCQLTRTGSN